MTRGAGHMPFELVCADPNVGSILFAMPADYGESTVSVTTDALAIAGPRGTVLIPVWMSPKHGGGYDVLAALHPANAMILFGLSLFLIMRIRQVIRAND